MATTLRTLLSLAIVLCVGGPIGRAQTGITTPGEAFGFNFGDDYQLASYRQIAAYWHTLDGQSDHLVENGEPLPPAKYFVPGSVLTARVDATQPLAHGMPDRVDVFFDNSPVFRLDAAAAARGVTPIAWFDSPAPLRSGWAWGQHYLDAGVAVVEARVGRGRVLLFGPGILHRAQPHGTFKLFFNGLLLSGARRLPS